MLLLTITKGFRRTKPRDASGKAFFNDVSVRLVPEEWVRLGHMKTEGEGDTGMKAKM